MNYVIVTLMLVIAGIAGHLILTLIGREPAEAPVETNPERNTPATNPVNLRYDGTFQAISVGA
jgi:hypothetical protein